MQPDAFQNKFDVSRETIERLRIYERLLKEWGQSLSLVGRNTLDDIWERHFTDSAQIYNLVKMPLIDMGTGAGFPGMVLAMLGYEDGIHLSDNNQKKVEFLHTVAQETATNVTIHNCKIEAVPDQVFSTITSRALAPIDELLSLSARFFRPDSQAVFLKGKTHNTELETAQKGWNFVYETTPSLTNPEAAIVTIRNLERRKAA